MHLGYNTNGFAHHHPLDALDILAKLGYQSVGLTLDQGFLNPYAPDWPINLKLLKQKLQQHQSLRNLSVANNHHLIKEMVAVI